MAMYIGAFRRDVRHNPDIPIHLAGFSGREPTSNVRSYPQVRAIVLSDDTSDRRVAIVSADYCLFDQSFIEGVRAELAYFGYQSIIACTHNHAAPTTFHANPELDMEIREGYLEDVQRTILLTVTDAHMNQERVQSIKVHRDRVEANLVMNRTVLGTKSTSSGSKPWIFKQLEADAPMEVLTDVDRELGLVAIEDVSGKTTVLANFACHPVTLYRDDVSCDRDFVGPFIEELGEFNDIDFAMFLNGAAGDINPATRTRGPETAKRFARVLAAEAKSILETAGRECIHTFDFTEREVTIDYTNGEQRQLAISCLWIGDQPLVTIPGELYHQFGVAIKEAHMTAPFVIGFANGTAGYIPPAERLEDPTRYANDTGISSYHDTMVYAPGYGNPTGIPLPDIGERMVAAATELLS